MLLLMLVAMGCVALLLAALGACCMSHVACCCSCSWRWDAWPSFLPHSVHVACRMLHVAAHARGDGMRGPPSCRTRCMLHVACCMLLLMLVAMGCVALLLAALG